MKKKEFFFKRLQKTLHNKKAMFIDTGVLIIIAVVIGALTLGGLYVMTNETILPNVKEKVESMFDYTGNTVIETPKIKGDLNGDGVVDEADISIMRVEMFSLSGNYDISELDLNEDGNVDILDLVRIKKLAEANSQ